MGSMRNNMISKKTIISEKLLVIENKYILWLDSVPLTRQQRDDINSIIDSLDDLVRDILDNGVEFVPKSNGEYEK